MRQRLGQIAAGAATGALILTSCSTTTDVPETFAATVTVTGEANLASAETGECIIGANRVAPDDRVVILGDRGPAFAESSLEVGSIDQKPDGSDVCTYTAHIHDVPANQRSYKVTVISYASVTNFGFQVFTSDELKSGAATYRLLQNPPSPAGDGIGSEVQDSDGAP